MDIKTLEAWLREFRLLTPAFPLYEWYRAIDSEARKRYAELQENPLDGLPTPPPHLIMKVAGTPDPLIYFQGGERAAQSIVDILSTHAIEIQSLGAILDFGCGCGRVLRRWQHMKAVEIHGTDYNRTLVRWCSRNLPFARVTNNGLVPPTRYPNNRFDLVYALSVFTHLSEPLQLIWMNELRRILRPSGALLLSLHGDSYLPSLNEQERATFLRKQVVMRFERSAGTNLCCAFHPESFVREFLAKDFDVIDYVPEGATGNPHQDLWLLRKS
jgi:2-polyprenyl-3-methyl-5-hydroxy-6-metoxy-1,4-benzoquinol methylase